MTDDHSERDRTIDRRKVLAGLGAGAAAGLAGCSGNGDDGDDGDDGDGTDTGGGTDTPTGTADGGGTDSPTETDGSTGKVQGGTPVIGLDVAPTTLNPLQAGSTYDFLVIDRVFTYGTTVNPETTEFEPWLFTDWDLSPGNAVENPSDPAITATMRDDLTFHDGEDLTADDYAFTQRYFKRQNPTNSLTGAAQQNVARVEVQSPTEVDVYMSAKDQRWFTNVLGWPVLPQHVWSDVDDYTQYAPRDSEEGLVGSGAWRLTDFNWQNWYELETVDDYPIPGADYVDWIDSEGPYVDGLRFEVFGSQTAMEQALLNGEIDAGFHSTGFSVNTAVQAERSEEFTVQQNSSDGYNHVSYNTRRVPFDDVAFRQFLNKSMDKQWIVENPHQGISGTRGDYVVIPALERWRPPEPSELVGEEFRAADRFDPVEIPDLSFPAPGSFNLSVEGIVEMRRFLVDNPDAEHDYSFGEQRTNITRAPPELVPGSDQELDDVPDRLKGAELYVNGQHLTEAHTDNAGEGGQGPLELSFQPPQEDVVQARYGQQYVGLLQKIGVPVEPLVKTINAQLPTIYAQEDFDMYAMAWSLGVNVTHLLQLYSSEGADLDEEIGTQVSNPMEYTGADDLIFEDGSLMDFSERVPIVKQIEARIYHDAPTNVTDIATLLEPTSDEFTGWVGTIGGVITNEDSYLNIARTE